MNTDYITSSLIAPCGMNCGLCLGYLREKNRCPGCNKDDKNKPVYCITCRIKNCSILAETNSKFCFSCSRYPCTRLKQLDKRYKKKYGMSMLENLNSIKNSGIRAFVKNEKSRWACPGCGSVVCVHRENCINCGQKRIINNYL